MAEHIRIIMADDHPIFRSGLRQALAAHEDVEILEEFADGKAALLAIEMLKPDVAILDIDMPGMGGLDVLRVLQERGDGTPVIILTMYNEPEMFNEAMDLGARGYVPKESAARELVEALRLVARGSYYISPSMSAYLVERRASTDRLRETIPGLQTLTPAERKVLKQIAHGKTSKEIASLLNISVRTVDSHRLNISTKLNIRGTHQLLKFAVQNKSLL